MILNRQKKQKVDIRRASRILKYILRHLDCQDWEVNVLFIDDEEIRGYHRSYLGRDRATNVLSFSMQEGEFGQMNPELLGDILISVERASRDASHSSVPLEDMLDYLIIHGILHLLGYDHERFAESAPAMKKMEERLFKLIHGYSISSLSE